MLYLWWSNDHALDIMLLCLLYYCHCLPLLGGMSCTHYCLTTLTHTVSWSSYQHHHTNTTLCLTVLTPHSYLSIVVMMVSVLLATIPCDPVYSPPKPFSIQCLLSLPSQQSDNTEILSENTNTALYDVHSTLHALENTFNKCRIACKKLGVRFLINEGNIYIHSKVQYLHCDTGGNDVLHDD